MKIWFDLAISSGFGVRDNWPVPTGELSFVEMIIEFEHVDGELIMKEAEDKLEKEFKTKYPDKDYRITYWEWR